MSGTFVEMLRRIVDMSGYTANPGAGPEGVAATETVAPLRTLDGFGAFVPPPSTAKPVPADYRDRASADHPPGFYGPADGPFRGQYAGGRRSHRAARLSALKARSGSYPIPSRSDLRGHSAVVVARCCSWSTRIIVHLLGAGLAALLRAARRLGGAGVRGDLGGADECAGAVACRREG